MCVCACLFGCVVVFYACAVCKCLGVNNDLSTVRSRKHGITACVTCTHGVGRGGAKPTVACYLND